MAWTFTCLKGETHHHQSGMSPNSPGASCRPQDLRTQHCRFRTGLISERISGPLPDGRISVRDKEGPRQKLDSNLTSHPGTLKSLGHGNMSVGEGDPKSGCLSLAHTLLGLHRTGGEEEVAQGCGCYLWTSSAVEKPEEPQCTAESPGSLPPFPESSHPLQLFGVHWKSPLRPASYKPSHGLTFVLSNRSDLLPASMAVFKVHLWGTQTDCSDKARHGAVCVFPQASWDPGWGGGDESSVLLVCRMKLPCGFFLLWLGLVGSLAESDPSLKGEESFSDWGLRHLRGSFESVNSYVDSFMELLGGKNGICQYRCRYGEYLGAFSGVGVGSRGGCWVMGCSAGHVCPTPGRPGYQTEQIRCSNVRNPSRQQIPTRSLGCHLGPISPDQLCFI